MISPEYQGWASPPPGMKSSATSEGLPASTLDHKRAAEEEIPPFWPWRMTGKKRGSARTGWPSFVYHRLLELGDLRPRARLLHDSMACSLENLDLNALRRRRREDRIHGRRLQLNRISDDKGGDDRRDEGVGVGNRDGQRVARRDEGSLHFDRGVGS